MNTKKKSAATKKTSVARDEHIVRNLRTIMEFAGVSHDGVVRTLRLVEFMRGLPS